MLNYHKPDFFKLLKLDILACVILFSIFIFCQITTTTNKKLKHFVRNCYYPIKIQEFVQRLLEMIVLTFVYLLSAPSLDCGAHGQTVRPGQRCQGGL